MRTAITSCNTLLTDTSDDWHADQNRKFVNRYVAALRSLGVSATHRFYDKIATLLGSEYWLWVFLCGHQNDLAEVGSLASGRRAELEILTRKRIGRITKSAITFPPSYRL